ncbi:hypothetical protein [Methylocystis echinoides]|uniref:Uncharacterized protein n=1 Tax=Methylocystis echinoides TaxID=29468 RepID=A0A9W6LQ84_9HYPH|nr:hypothetical protein [Methylocystis echinoides]GLI91101.1 hypothetical protein LMG27198_00930 [Methylocystis echinoides]
MTSVTLPARIGRNFANFFARRPFLRVAAPVVLLGGMALPSVAATYYFIFDIHGTSGSPTYFEGVAKFTTTDNAIVAGATYYFSEIQGYRGIVNGAPTVFYTPTQIGIGTTDSALFGQNSGTYNALSSGTYQTNTPGSGQGGVVANALGSITCPTATTCYLKDAAFGYNVNGSYYWIEGTRGSDSGTQLDIHNTTAPTGTFPYTAPGEGYLSPPGSQVVQSTKSDCGATVTAINDAACAPLTSDPLPEINSGALPKAALLLGYSSGSGRLALISVFEISA